VADSYLDEESDEEIIRCPKIYVNSKLSIQESPFYSKIDSFSNSQHQPLDEYHVLEENDLIPNDLSESDI